MTIAELSTLGACGRPENLGLDFFPDGGDTSEQQEVCRRCPVRDGCLAYALESGQEYGIWGGVDVGRPERDRRSGSKRAAA